MPGPALPLPLAGRAARPWAALPLPLALPLTAGRVGLPGIGELASGLLELRRRPGQVAVRGDLALGPRQGLAQPVQRALGAGRVALGKALRRVMQGGRRGSVRTGCRGLLLGELTGQVRALLGCHLIELFSESIEVFLCLLRVAVLVGVGFAGRRPREGAAQRRHGRRALFGGRVDLRSDARLDRSQLGEIDIELVRAVAQLTGQVTQVLGQARPRVLGVRALGFELLGKLVESFGLLVRRLAHLALLGDRGVLGVRDEQDRGQEERRDRGGDGRLAGEPGSEQVRRGAAQGGNGIGTLAADETVGLGGLIDGSRVHDESAVGLLRFGGRPGRGREPDRQLERARDAIAELRFHVDRECRLAKRRSGADHRNQQGHGADDRDGGPGDRRPLEGYEPGNGPEDEFCDQDGRQREPRAANDPADPEASPVRGETGADREQGGIQRAVDDPPRIDRDVRDLGGARTGGASTGVRSSRDRSLGFAPSQAWPPAAGR